MHKFRRANRAVALLGRHLILSGARSVTSAQSNPIGATEGRDLRRREQEVRSNLQENENLHLFLMIGSLKPFAAADH